VARVTGEIGLEEKVLVIRRIHVKFELQADAARTVPGSTRPGYRGPGNLQKAYALHMRDEPVIDMRLTHLMALDASLSDVRSALMRAARIRSGFSAEVRGLLAQVDDLDRRVMAEVIAP